MLGPEIGLQLLMIPEAYGGLGGGRATAASHARDGQDLPGHHHRPSLRSSWGPTHPGRGHEAQKRSGSGRSPPARPSCLCRVTEPECGQQRRRPQDQGRPGDGRLRQGHGLPHQRQQAVHLYGGYADFITVLADAPEGPTFFIMEKDTPATGAGKGEEKHGIRASNTRR